MEVERVLPAVVSGGSRIELKQQWETVDDDDDDGLLLPFSWVVSQ